MFLFSADKISPSGGDKVKREKKMTEIYLEMWASTVALFLATEVVRNFSFVKLKSFAKKIWNDFLWFIENHEECPECGSQEYSIVVLPELPHPMYWDSSYIPMARKKCKKCGTIY